MGRTSLFFSGPQQLVQSEVTGVTDFRGPRNLVD
jgi:hypothetical protein